MLGTGLGLSITKNLIECRAGKSGLKVNSEKGQHFTFPFQFIWMETRLEPDHSQYQ